MAGLVVGFLAGRATAPSAPRLALAPTATVTVTPEVATPTGTATPTPSPTASPSATATPTPAPTATPSATPPPTTTPAPTATPAPTPTPTPTRGPLRITKLGLGVYGSGGAYQADIARWRPSVILLMDPTVEFARTIRATYPKAFIVGRRYVPDQRLDNPAGRGAAFADAVAQTALPLKGVINAWMSYNEVAAIYPTGNNFADWNVFQVAFAQRLQGTYGIDAVAGNDGPGAVEIGDYVKYFAGAIAASHYFGVHAYPGPDVHSLRQAGGPAAMLRYRRIHDALAAAGVKTPPFILTETGLYDGWRGVESAEDMAADFIWLDGELEKDPYMLGQTVFGLFDPTNQQWQRFNVAGTAIEDVVGTYNSCTTAHPCPPGLTG